MVTSVLHKPNTQRGGIIVVIVALIFLALIIMSSSSTPAKTMSRKHDDDAPSVHTALNLTSSSFAYLDNNATTPCFDAVLQKVIQVSQCCFANPSSMHLAGQRSRQELERCRKDMRRMVSASRYGLVFTSGATESNNLAIRACIKRFTEAAASADPNGSRVLKVITTPLEHPSVYETLANLPHVEVVTLHVCPQGLIDIQDLTNALNDPDVVMACIAVANSEIGVLQDAVAISKACQVHGVYCHMDMTQVFGRYPLNLNMLGADSITLSAHKFHGPKGTGGLFYTLARPPPLPCTTGGKQEDGVRGGTENLPSVAGMALALRMCHERITAGSRDRMRQMRDRIEAGLAASFSSSSSLTMKVHGPRDPNQRLYQTLSVVLPYPSVAVIKELSDQRVYVGIGGCACSKGKYSKALDAIGVQPEEMARTVRISLGQLNTEADVDRLLKCMRITLARLSKQKW